MHKLFTYNFVLFAALLGWFLAQFLKIILMLIKSRRIRIKLLFSTGGMPSAHSCMVSALATAIGLVSGFESPLFAATSIFAAVVMFDAQSIRKAAGQQARVLNQIVDEFFKHHKVSEHKLAELLGHTRFEVLVGMVLGIASSVVLYRLMPAV
jgi:uncharacterized protein